MIHIVKAVIMVLTVVSIVNASAPVEVHRFLLAAGANNGGQGRATLRYAVTDARAFAAVLTDMGGIEPQNKVFLSEPSAAEMRRGFSSIENMLKNPKYANGRKEIIVYYSGHADEKGLRLGKELMLWPDFRKAVDNIDADLKIAILDACGSGAITRIKGGIARPAFLSDASSDMKGYAFLTSSSESEVSQESDRIRGSFFTNALVSGLRGAADMTGSGTVTLSEAYQFAFNNTLESTQSTIGGAQHPSRDINLTGTGDVVMTDLRQINSGLTLDADLEGRLFIRDQKGFLIAELYKTKGRAVELGLPAGKYNVFMEHKVSYNAENLTLGSGEKVLLTPDMLKPVKREITRKRGNEETGEDEEDYDSDESEDEDYAQDESENHNENEVTVQDESENENVSENNDENVSPDVKISANPMLDSARSASFEFKSYIAYTYSNAPANGIQLSLFVNDARAEYAGTQIALITNLARKDMTGLQVGYVSNIALGNFHGVQAAAFNLAMYCDSSIQAGFINTAKNSGLQGGAINIAENAAYLQAGFINVATGNVGYVQAGNINIAGDVGYVQAGNVNIAKSIGHVQVGTVNIAENAGNLQIGNVNIASRVNRQIGLVNIAGYSEKTPIGLLNFAGNGIFTMTFYGDEAYMTGAMLNTGTTLLYSQLEYSQRPRWSSGWYDKWPKTWGWGLGTRFGMRTPFYMNLDFTSLKVHYENPVKEVNWRKLDNLDKQLKEARGYWFNNQGGRIRFGANYRLLPAAALTAGASINGVIEDKNGNLEIEPKHTGYWDASYKGHNARIWPGYYAGLTVGKF